MRPLPCSTRITILSLSLDGLHDPAAGSALASFVLAEDGVAILKCEQFGLSEFRGDDHVLASRAQRFGDEAFLKSAAMFACHVEEIDSDIERLANDGYSLRGVLINTKVVAPQPNDRRPYPGAPQFSHFHPKSPFSSRR